MVGVAIHGEKYMVWFREIESEEGKAYASVCAGDEDGGWFGFEGKRLYGMILRNWNCWSEMI